MMMIGTSFVICICASDTLVLIFFVKMLNTLNSF